MEVKSCKLDPLPAKVFRSFAKELTLIITHVVNTPIVCYKFPEEWKFSIVNPLLKKPGLEEIQKNYRPVSNLSFISKVSEICVLNQIIRHLDDNAPLPNYQSAYRANHGCETALLELINDILWCFEWEYVCVLCTMAFDTVDQDHLLTLLKNRFGIQAEAN